MKKSITDEQVLKQLMESETWPVEQHDMTVAARRIAAALHLDEGTALDCIRVETQIRDVMKATFAWFALQRHPPQTGQPVATDLAQMSDIAPALRRPSKRGAR